MKFVASSMEDGVRVAGTAEFGGLDAQISEKRSAGMVTLAGNLSPTETTQGESHRKQLGSLDAFPQDFSAGLA